jgi:hypothetical protein
LIGQLYDAGCVPVFDKTAVVITLYKMVLMPGKRHPVSRMWHLTIPLPGFPPAIEPSPHIAARQHLTQTITVAFANAARLSASPAELVSFAHAPLFSPSLWTLSTALDLMNVTSKYLPQSIATTMGHMDQSQKK